MSLLLKGFDMPKACMNAGCPLNETACDLWWRQGCGEHGRHADCPLVQMPDTSDQIRYICPKCDSILYVDKIKEVSGFKWCSNCGGKMERI